MTMNGYHVAESIVVETAVEPGKMSGIIQETKANLAEVESMLATTLTMLTAENHEQRTDQPNKCLMDDVMMNRELALSCREKARAVMKVLGV